MSINDDVCTSISDIFSTLLLYYFEFLYCYQYGLESYLDLNLIIIIGLFIEYKVCLVFNFTLLLLSYDCSSIICYLIIFELKSIASYVIWPSLNCIIQVATNINLGLRMV